MLGLRLISGFSARAAAKYGARNMSVISGPPTVHISNAERIAHGVVITVAILAYPTWVLVNIRNYRGLN